jgi:carboxypeptidase family protein
MVMAKQAASGFMVVALLLAAACTAQGPARPETASITGSVVTLDGYAVQNAQVDLRDALTGTSLQSAYTNPAGRFEIGDVAPGRYLVVATSGLDEVRESVQVSRMSEVILRLQRSFSDTSAGDAGATCNATSLFEEALCALDRALAVPNA